MRSKRSRMPRRNQQTFAILGYGLRSAASDRLQVSEVGHHAVAIQRTTIGERHVWPTSGKRIDCLRSPRCTLRIRHAGRSHVVLRGVRVAPLTTVAVALRW